MADELIRIPCTATRRAKGFAKLLVRVDPNAETGFGFDGSLVKPGKLVEWAELWPTPGHPPTPILLEYAGPAKKPESGWKRHDVPDQYLLWRFDTRTRTWSEVARSESTSWTWAMELRPIAVRLLRESRGVEVEVYADFNASVERADRLIEVILRRLPEAEHGRALSVIHDRLCVRLSGSLLG